MKNGFLDPVGLTLIASLFVLIWALSHSLELVAGLSVAAFAVDRLLR